ncbi:UNVERIFIED_CONTAM: biosynthetic-type acetolactate synthase large subunit [Halobacillus marinus]|uniref:biosynthetic-type acetolactate synthase large subunit n=1 Tax=Bacillaceae TaxID=186817 RepID=UPI0002A4D1EA|nr:MULTISPECIES: biosynthetic-type acetolactate synthase large subunit [Bacillaceae]ELK46520.1 acetolactate synthase large subunit [Halobacillus sp. BAB-2008]QHT46125.1 biosynthetic-type acetolactate synthase large subunit [Bacillus sp. SB49]
MKAQASVEEQTMTKTGADLLVEALVEEGVDTLFGYPGGAVLPIYDAIYRAEGSFDHVLPRHEQGAIHAAEGYARVSGRAGVVIGTSGPGATNLVTGIADAMMDSIPLVIFTGQVAKGVIGTDAFQESDIMGITTPITKHNYQIQEIEELPRVVKEAFHIATTGRPGPVVVDIPKDISSTVHHKKIDNDFHLPGYQPTVKPNPLQINKLHEALVKAEKPVVLAGSGVIHAQASEELIKFVRNYQLPVTTTLLGLGSYPGSDDLSMGMAGMHGTYAANMALYECDLLINIGSRFDDRLTGNLKHFAPHATVAHIDIDPAEIGKNIPTHIPIVSDAKAALESLNDKPVEGLHHEGWMDGITRNKTDFPLWHDLPEEDIVPQWLLQKVYEYTEGNAVVTTDVGQHQMWAAQYYAFDKPNRWVTSGGLGTMGFGFPAAIGAQLADRESTCIAVVGDGGFQMTLQELSVLQERRLPVKVLIVNNQALGMVRQWQEKFYEERYSESIIDTQPDFVKLAESYQIPGYKIETQSQLEEVLPRILKDDQPAVIDCRVLQKENVYPMIAPGKGLHEMIGVKR